MYEVLKTVHVLGVVLLIGNVTVSAVWKVFADRTADARIMQFAQRLITLTDWSLTLTGIVFIIIGGYGMLYLTDTSAAASSWLIVGQLLFVVSGAIWLGVLVPAQIRLARGARAMTASDKVCTAYRADGRLWLFWGVIATIPLIGAVYIMIAKPWN